MRISYEKDLREQLAQRLAVIEPGLHLVETEYSISNAEGTRGRIDILARDGHSSWVVIELKRADGSAGRALHEVTKYTELLGREMGLRPDRIRAVIVSTTWKELLVPVSNMARGSPHDLRGYHLILGKDGELVRADRVALLPAPTVPRVTPVHFIYFFDSPQDRDRAGSRWLTERLKLVLTTSSRRTSGESASWTWSGLPLGYTSRLVK